MKKFKSVYGKVCTFVINVYACWHMPSVEAMFFRFKTPLFLFCLFANSASYTKLPDFTGFYWIIADSTKIFDSCVNPAHFMSFSNCNSL